MNIGITTRSYSGMTTLETAEHMQADGFKVTELCFCQSDLPGWRYNGISDLSGITKELVKEKADIYRSHGIEVKALGIFTNLIIEEGEEREHIRAYLSDMVRLCAYAGIATVTSECGFYANRAIYASTYEKDFRSLKENTAFLAKEAAKHGINVAIEPCVLDILPSCKRVRDFLYQLKCEENINNVGVMLDMANMIANSSEYDAFSYLADKIIYFHGKDRHVNDAYGRLLGDGDIDWPYFFELYKKYTPDTPFILEYANCNNAFSTKERVMKYYGSN